MKTMQIESGSDFGGVGETAREILKAARVQRIHPGWYTVNYNGISLDSSTVVSARRNSRGEIKQK